MQPASPSYFFLSLMNGSAWGGSEELWYRTALSLSKSGAKVACAVYDWPEKNVRLQMLERAGCVVYRLPNKKLLASHSLRKVYEKLRLKIRLKTTIKSLPWNEYDLVVVNQGGYEVYAWPWEKVYRLLPTYVLLFHNYNEHQTFSARQQRALKHWVQNAAASFFAAQRMIVVLSEKLSFSIPGASVVFNPITFEPPDSPTAFPPLQNGSYVMAMFAALDVNRKAQDKLVQVLSAPKWKERPWQLYLYGKGNDQAFLQELINNTGLREKVFLKGHTPSVAQAMQAAHLVLQITNIDAMPLSVVEAMAMSRPVVVSPVGDMPLWVLHQQNGWVCNTGSAAMDAALEEAWQARAQWEEMGKRSFALFKEKFPQKPEARFLQQLNQQIKQRKA